MNELFAKVSSYHVFSYILPGVVCAILVDSVLGTHLTSRDVVSALFLYYFLGLVVSRVGSLILEPALRWTGFVRFADYKSFVLAAQRDPKLDVLSETNNTYRTLAALFLVLLVVDGYSKIESAFPGVRGWRLALLGAALLPMFLFSFRKQTSYIVARINAVSGRPETGGGGDQ